MDDKRRSERSRDVRDPRVAHRVPKASFGGATGPLLTAFFPETIEKTLWGSLLLRIKSPLLYQLS